MTYELYISPVYSLMSDSKAAQKPLQVLDGCGSILQGPPNLRANRMPCIVRFTVLNEWRRIAKFIRSQNHILSN